VNPVAASFAWPFRGDRLARWLVGMVMVVLLPIAFIPLLGYAVAATRAASADPSAAPPRWELSARLLSDGVWVALAVVLVTAPFVLLAGPIATLVDNAHLWRVSDPTLSHLYSSLAAGFALALPWGIVLLLLMPHATVRFAATGRPLDLFDFPSALRGIGSDFGTMEPCGSRDRHRVGGRARMRRTALRRHRARCFLRHPCQRTCLRRARP